MAGDWIKVEHGLPNKPEVMQLAEKLGVTELEVVGHLVLFWTWVDQNLSPDCPAVNGTISGLDRVAQRDGFATALVSVGWLSVDRGKISIPNYDHHLSESAKKRALDTRKKRRQRDVSRNCPATVPKATGQTGVQKGVREEKSIEKSNTYTPSRHLVSEEFVSAWDAWKNKQAVASGVMMDSMTECAQLYQLENFETIEAIEVVRFSTSRTNCKNLLVRGEHKQKPQEQSNGTRYGKKKTMADYVLPIEDGSDND